MPYKTRIMALLAPLAIATLVASGCTSGTPSKAAHTQPTPTSTRSITVIPAPAAERTKQVPKGLVGKTIGKAKATLAKVGFTRVVVAGGQGVTDATKVTDVSHAGKKIAPDTKIVLTGKPQTPTSSSTGPSNGCMQDDSQCYMNGKRCATGSCVNAARGLSSGDVRHQTNNWLSRHPGYCAYGQTGAVDKCSDAPGGRQLTDTDPEFRDANGDTKAEYCARKGYSLSNCPAG